MGPLVGQAPCGSALAICWLVGLGGERPGHLLASRALCESALASSQLVGLRVRAPWPSFG
eukprot:12401481-Karenia_brevis.AAC.1